jgi:hypothetical protein
MPPRPGSSPPRCAAITTASTRTIHVAISFDIFYDGRNGFQFTLTAAGGLRDGTIVDEGLQADWNGIYEARASRDDQGWSAEYAIPFKTLRYPPSREQTWHIQLDARSTR